LQTLREENVYQFALGGKAEMPPNILVGISYKPTLMKGAEEN